MPDNEQSAAASPPVAVVEKAKPQSQKKPKKQPPYNVVLLDDDDHTYDYVIEMLGKLFHHDRTKAYSMAKTVDTQGRVIVLTTTKEHAELKRDQILAYGADPRMERSDGSMSAIIEPAME